jgi:hypothetical protein
MFLGEMLIGIDLDGDEPGEVSKCMLDIWVAYGVGRCMYIHNDRALSAVNSFAWMGGVRVNLASRQVDRGENGR